MAMATKMMQKSSLGLGFPPCNPRLPDLGLRIPWPLDSITTLTLHLTRYTTASSCLRPPNPLMPVTSPAICRFLISRTTAAKKSNTFACPIVTSSSSFATSALLQVYFHNHVPRGTLDSKKNSMELVFKRYMEIFGNSKIFEFARIYFHGST